MQENAITPEQSSYASSATAPVENRGDKHIWGIYIFLCLISIVELYSASSREVAKAGYGVYGTILRHGGQLLLGFFLLYYIQKIPYQRFYKWIIWFSLASALMMAYALLFGERINGATRSFSLILFSIQPAEFLKISSAMLVALIMSRNQVKGGGVSDSGVQLSALIILFFCAMLAPEGLTNTLLLMCISMSMMIIGGVSMKKLATVLLVYVICFAGYVGFKILMDKQSEEKTEQVDTAAYGEDQAPESRIGTWQYRLENWWNSGPKYEEKLTSDNMQEQYGYMAQAHGGLFGVMPGNSRETARLPLAFTDYIYSIIVEELGFVGGVIVLILYLWLLARASAVASKCVRAFPALLVIGMALTIVFQALFHICIVTGVMPVSGQPLPLISKGGSSILVTSIAFGVMLSVSRFAVRNTAKRKDINLEKEALPEDLRADNPSQL